MGKVLSIEPKKIKPGRPNPHFHPSEKSIQELFFEEDYNKLPLLGSINLPLPPNPTLLYPGCGIDILFPLHYIHLLFPTATQITLIFVDTDPVLDAIKTQLHQLGIQFQGNTVIEFFWKRIHITLDTRQGSIFTMGLPKFNIYFERAFRILKDQDPSYEQKIIHAMPKGSILISDSGFDTFPLQRIPVNPDLSVYKEMVMAIL